jgi:transcriptional regulator NrdR family protein
VNPDLNETALEKLEEPAAVEPEQYHTARATDTGVVMRDMTTEEFQRYQQAEKTYDRALARYTIKRKALNGFTQEIGRTISRRYIHLIQSDDTAYARLKKLKKHLCPSTAETELQLIAKYRQLQSRPRNNIDTWLKE